MRLRERAPHRARRGRSAPPPLRADCALFLDIDGTLAEIAAEPHLVRIEKDVIGLLPRLSRRLGGALALVTGRSITDVDRLLPAPRLPVAGQHGCERRDAEGTIHLHAPAIATHARLRALLADLAARYDGLMLEDKGLTIALHYRQSPHLAAHVHQTLRSSLAEVEDAGDYVLQSGKMLVEVRPEARDKGTAIRDFMAEPPFAGRHPVFVGDDRTDEDGFAVVESRGGWSIKVGPGRTAARFRLPDVSAVRRWLLAVPAAESDMGPVRPLCDPSTSS
jgi:trehalose 6-phosphate phosphatase